MRIRLVYACIILGMFLIASALADENFFYKSCQPIGSSKSESGNTVDVLKEGISVGRSDVENNKKIKLFADSAVWGHASASGTVWDEFTYDKDDEFNRIKLNYNILGFIKGVASPIKITGEGNADLKIILKLNDLTDFEEIDKKIIYPDIGESDSFDTPLIDKNFNKEELQGYLSNVWLKKGHKYRIELTAQVSVDNRYLSRIVADFHGSSLHPDYGIMWECAEVRSTIENAPMEVIFPDPNLEAAIRAAINKPEGAIYIADLEGLKSLNANEKSIKDITGLEYCRNLKELSLAINQITNVSPLSGLTNLEDLFLQGNQITDVSPLYGLTNLKTLWLDSNPITDVSPLSGLTNLERLWLTNNQITDLLPLSGLTNLQEMSLGANQITDISPLSELTNLEILYLNYNQITDISPLSGLKKMKLLVLSNNQITDISPLSGLTNSDTRWLNSFPATGVRTTDKPGISVVIL